MTCVDDGLTLSHQPKEYWAGNYAKAHEGNPWFYHLLAHHPTTFIAWEAVSVLVFTGMVLMMPQTLALTIPRKWRPGLPKPPRTQLGDKLPVPLSVTVFELTP
jgi:hypothetical protein